MWYFEIIASSTDLATPFLPVVLFSPRFIKYSSSKVWVSFADACLDSPLLASLALHRTGCQPAAGVQFARRRDSGATGAMLRVVVLCALANVVCYADRTNISVAILAMSDTLQWTPAQQGWQLRNEREKEKERERRRRRECERGYTGISSLTFHFYKCSAWRQAGCCRAFFMAT